MLSIGKLTVEQSRYYERQVAQGRDDYYAGRGEAAGRWTGRGSAILGLGREVDKDGFAALMEGRDPATDERLKRMGGRSQVAAFDLTFSAPKSVSVLFAVGGPALSRARSRRTSQRSTPRWTTWSARRVACVAAAEACGVRWGRGSSRLAIAIA